MSTKNEPATFG